LKEDEKAKGESNLFSVTIKMKMAIMRVKSEEMKKKKKVMTKMI
jgi:hypothetical protein